MASNHETFWENRSFAVVGDTAKKNFPLLTYGGLKKLGKTVYPIDPTVEEIAGDRAFADLASLPEMVDAVILEVPKEDTLDWVKKAADLGVEHLWIHMQRETPEAVALARKRGMNVRSGTCAVMYVLPGFTYHTIHKWIMKLVGTY